MALSIWPSSSNRLAWVNRVKHQRHSFGNWIRRQLAAADAGD